MKPKMKQLNLTTPQKEPDLVSKTITTVLLLEEAVEVNEAAKEVVEAEIGNPEAEVDVLNAEKRVTFLENAPIRAKEAEMEVVVSNVAKKATFLGNALTKLQEWEAITNVSSVERLDISAENAPKEAEINASIAERRVIFPGLALVSLN